MVVRRTWRRDHYFLRRSFKSYFRGSGVRIELESWGRKGVVVGDTRSLISSLSLP